MHNDNGSALALRSQYRQWESRAARLSLLVDTGRELGALAPGEMGERVLQRACAFCAMDSGLVVRELNGENQVLASHGAHSSEQRVALLALAENDSPLAQCLAIDKSGLQLVIRLPLSTAQGSPFGCVLLASAVKINPPDDEDLESLQLLATLLAAHLDNQRLHGDLLARERTMSELVHRLLSAQEDERRRVAYDLHDGLAQTLAGLHQRLQGFASQCPTLPDAQQQELSTILDLAQRCVREGRQAIAGLRPQLLDDFGLLQALDKEADRLREAGYRVQWLQRSDARLPANVEITLFRIAQEGINNILKHAGPCSVRIGLSSAEQSAELRVEDDGRGFDTAPDRSVSGSGGLGLAAMHERASLLSGHLHCSSEPGRGTRLLARVPSLGGSPQ
ncbi:MULTISPECIES: sensor histidine kinase [Pseudomonas]|uniref:Oxygen sensor histidine kinase NreB n=2 Tax=Pseudomonadaceae TaxID=135621 RepID=A0A0D0KV64_9PSED|nr:MULTISPECIES: sensor histidine kinase [Pseudomonas]KIQ00988.1 histidine kinase [Pseudomonas fulva]MCW2294906.1 signal transduction histidine kinase [Pseudomonas sp. BIGb0408]NYH75820.1 signal transduction histidine kinase [Pseudomonas flavescens]